MRKRGERKREERETVREREIGAAHAAPLQRKEGPLAVGPGDLAGPLPARGLAGGGPGRRRPNREKRGRESGGQ